MDSTAFLKPSCPSPAFLPGALPMRANPPTSPTAAKSRDMIAALDLGQTVVISDRACVAVEAMEGTDETIERAARLVCGNRWWL